MKKIELRKQFENTLDRIGVKEKFLDNVQKECPDNLRYNRRMNLINVQNNIHDALHIAFIWVSTPEGDKFWEKTARRFE